MKVSKKLLSLLPLLLASTFFFTGCEALNLRSLISDAEAAADALMTTPNFEAEECFAFQFPVTIAQEDLSETFNTAGELDAFLEGLAREERRSWDFVLPVTLTLEGAENAQTISTEEELREIFRDCHGGKRGDCNNNEEGGEEEETGDNT